MISFRTKPKLLSGCARPITTESRITTRAKKPGSIKCIRAFLLFTFYFLLLSRLFDPRTNEIEDILRWAIDGLDRDLLQDAYHEGYEHGRAVAVAEKRAAAG